MRAQEHASARASVAQIARESALVARASRAALTAAMLALCMPVPAHAQPPTPGAYAKTSLHRTDFTSSDGVRLSVLEAGLASNEVPVIAFIPGWSMPASLWQAQLVALGARCRVAALDPRGQGASAIPEGGYTLERRAEDLHEFIARYARVVLVAWSLGALEALHYLHRHGDAALAGLVIVDSSVGEEPAPAKPAPGQGFVEELKRDRARAVEGFIQAMFRRAQPRAQIEALRDAALRMPFEGSLSLFPSDVPREHWRALARGFAKPLMYVVTPQFAAQAANLSKHRRGTRVLVFRTAGHALFVDEPTRFNRALADFVTDIYRTGR